LTFFHKPAGMNKAYRYYVGMRKAKSLELQNKPRKKIPFPEGIKRREFFSLNQLLRRAQTTYLNTFPVKVRKYANLCLFLFFV